VLRLSLDANGAVVGAEVMGEPSNGLGEAARQAALRLRFEPARRAGVPIPAYILYQYEFRLSDAAAAAPAVPPANAAGVSPASPAAGPSLAAPASDGALDVTVRQQSRADHLRRSAEAVKVIETQRAQRESSDLGDVLARAPGVAVRRMGGLGSGAQLSLNGLRDRQVSLFLDGVPLELTGYTFGLANVPVNLVTRVEVYAGVVPIRFGADALGGAINLVSDEAFRGNTLGASYQVGSFGTHRLSAAGQAVLPDGGWFVRADTFLDLARNDYPVDVDLVNEVGRVEPGRAHRFHDAYRALGAGVELGIVNQPWARRLSLRAYYSDYQQELQHNAAMTVPYGEARQEQSNAGVSARYSNDIGPLSLSAVAGLAHSSDRFLDVSSCVYDWRGACVRQRGFPGELGPYSGNNGSDQRTRRDTVFARALLGWQLSDDQTLRLALAPTLFRQRGEDRRLVGLDVRDPLAGRRGLFNLVSGLEYQLQLFDDRLEGIAFAKHYYQSLEYRPEGESARDADRQRFGVGGSARYALTDWLLTKASYEFATRLLAPEEVFGDNALIAGNPELEPEVSHNVNLGLAVDLRETTSGSWRGGVSLFLRDTDRLILLTLQNGSSVRQSYDNVYAARSTGAELSAGWTSPGNWLALDANLTQQSVVNTSSQGTFGTFEGARLPNRPSLFANLEARLTASDLLLARDELSLVLRSNWIDEFYRGWEGIGADEFKQTVRSQLMHGAALTYMAQWSTTQLATTLEVDNLTNEKAFDFYGVQKPGRAYYAKLSVQH
jgi:outer membrane cobalamin receptor